jgi:hypothetical protein
VIAFFESSLVRFCLSGTLILVFAAADAWLRRRIPAPVRVAPPRWMHAVVGASLLGYYALIAPTGGALLGGAGNLLGIALVAGAIAMHASRHVRYPDLASRSLFYVALPIAVGVPWGLLVLSLPACAASVYCCARAERLARAAPAVTPAAPELPRYRMVPGIW